MPSTARLWNAARSARKPVVLDVGEVVVVDGLRAQGFLRAGHRHIEHAVHGYAPVPCAQRMLMMVWVIWSAVRDHLRVRLEVALRGDHVDELLGHVDVRRLRARPTAPGRSRSCRPGRAAPGPRRRSRPTACCRAAAGPAGSAKLAMATWPSGCELPLVKRACTMPVSSMSMPMRRPVV